MRRTMPKDIDEYIARHSAKDHRLLRQMGATIRRAAPEATENLTFKSPSGTEKCIAYNVLPKMSLYVMRASTFFAGVLPLT